MSEEQRMLEESNTGDEANFLYVEYGLRKGS